MRLLILLFLLVLSSNSNAENLVIPKQINDYITKDGCKQVSDFYSQHETIQGAPFIYELNNKMIDNFYEKTNEFDNSFAVWCERGVNEVTTYYLKFNIQSALNPFASCPREIPHNHEIGKLSIEKIKNMPLNQFYDSATGSFEDALEKVSGFVITSSYDGTGYRFYCESRSNKWKVLPFH